VNPLRVVVYDDFEPFSKDSKGIDADLGTMLANALGRKPEIVGVRAADDVNKDLRNMIGKGYHTVNIPLAHVMMHVPVDKTIGGAFTGAVVFSPYYKESFVLLRNCKDIKEYRDATVFKEHKVGVEMNSLPQVYLLSKVGQESAANVVQFKEVSEAVKALQAGDISAIMATRAQLESLVGPSPADFAYSDVQEGGVIQVPSWNVGLAVKTDNVQLRDDLGRAMEQIRSSGQLNELFERYKTTYVAPSIINR